MKPLGRKLTSGVLRQFLRYDPISGVFVWLVKSSPHVRAGIVAGSKDKRGRIRINVKKRHYQASRLAWLYMTGEWPKQEIDHVNRIPSDNRWKNLRDISHAGNQHNRAPGKGAVRKLGGKKFYAILRVNGKTLTLGGFADKRIAQKAYLNAKRKYHPEYVENPE